MEYDTSHGIGSDLDDVASDNDTTCSGSSVNGDDGAHGDEGDAQVADVDVASEQCREGHLSLHTAALSVEKLRSGRICRRKVIAADENRRENGMSHHEAIHGVQSSNMVSRVDSSDTTEHTI